MEVSISTAAKMVGIERSTFYRHIEQKGISLIDAETARPKVAVAELLRVYGDKVRMPEQIADKKKLSHPTNMDSSMDLKIEVETLKTQVKYLGELRETEKRGFEAQIQLLKSFLGNTMQLQPA